MAMSYKNWATQIKKGYLELCVLSLIEQHNKLYGFQLIKLLEELGITMKEGTLYPLMNRMTTDKVLLAKWEIKEIKGHPRKFYSLSKSGLKLLQEMKEEYQNMYDNYLKIGERNE